jgi:tRNA A37 methylthiotransferase MiaB
VEKIREKGGRHIDIQDRERKERFYKAEYRDDNKHAQVVISTGCSNHCTYCVVPSARGELRLRSPKDIIAEVKNNVKLGKTKITLLGQNVNDYRFEKSTVPAYRPGRHSRQ